jgi:HTH-type transcriptional regulator/antitoxin HipB
MQIRTPRALGAFVRDARKRRGMTQAQLADRARVSRTWVVDLEAGKRTLEIGLVMLVLEILGLIIKLEQARALGGHAAAYGTLEIAPAETLLDRVDPKTGSRS